MKKTLGIILTIISIQMGYSQCSWDSEICISGCSDIWKGEAQTRTCFDPSSATAANPIQIDYCFSAPQELFSEAFSPTIGNFIRKRSSNFVLCVPEDICSADISLFQVAIDKETGQETGAVLINDFPDVNTEDNRPTLCQDCPGSSNKIDLPHRDILNTVGNYKMCIDFKCCDGNGDIEDDNIIGEGSFCFYYEFINAASGVDVELAFTASQEIETLNGDSDIDGIIPSDSSFPGPALGPASAGVRVSAVGNGIIDYTVKLYEVDCNDTGSQTLINSQNIPYDGDEIVFYSFLNIPNWETIFDPTACYKVVTEVNSVCGTYSEEAYFTITDSCIFCLTTPDGDQEMEMSVSSESVQAYINGSNEVIVDTEEVLHSIMVLDEYGRVLKKKDILDQYNNHISFGSLNSHSRYFLIVTITESGQVIKSMIPNLR